MIGILQFGGENMEIIAFFGIILLLKTFGENYMMPYKIFLDVTCPGRVRPWFLDGQKKDKYLLNILWIAGNKSSDKEMAITGEPKSEYMDGHQNGHLQKCENDGIY